jgi:hypothetical protein
VLYFSEHLPPQEYLRSSRFSGIDDNEKMKRTNTLRSIVIGLDQKKSEDRRSNADSSLACILRSVISGFFLSYFQFFLQFGFLV